MARMFPSEIRDTGSTAEGKIFGLIQKELSDEWIVLHSLGIVGHKFKPWAEIDFVLIGPTGIFCLEVKGGRISRKDGRYLYTDRHGNTTSKKEGPFEQVAPAAAALRRHLIQKLPAIKNCSVGYGVLTPDVPFDISGPDIEPKVVYDISDGARKFGAYIRRVIDYWHERFEIQTGYPVNSLTLPQVKAIHDELRGDFDLRPSLRTRIGFVKDELLSLTEEQYAILDALRENERAIIKGGAGTGKTLLAIEESLRQARAGSKVLLCCYNRHLAYFIQEAVKSTPRVTACSFHSFMASAVKEAGLANKLPPAEEDDLFTVFYPELCLEALLALDRLQTFDVIVLDEGQDLLRQNYLEVLDATLKNGIAHGQWRIFFDQHQDIFGSISVEGMKTLQKGNPAQYRLSTNCRNSRPIGVATRIISGVRCEETLRAAGPEVEHEWHGSDAEQRRNVSNCINRLLSGHVRPNEIVVLSRYRLENSALNAGLLNVAYPLREEDPSRDFRKEDCVRFATIGTFKGLESDAVLLVDVDNLDRAEFRYGLYVGASRARAHLSVFLDLRVKQAYQALAQEHAHYLLETLKTSPSS